jgi:hypothetical protein
MSHFRLFRLLLVILASSFLFGCGAQGALFQKVAELPQGKGIVYVYRPTGFVGSGVTYDVHAGDRVIGNLKPGGYCSYFAAPGELEVWAKTEAKSSVTVDVRAGQEHFIKGGVGVGFFVGRPTLTIVDPDTGRREIATCEETGN